MPKKFEKEFISYCENQNLEVNPNQIKVIKKLEDYHNSCLLYTSPSPRDMRRSRMPSSA